MQSGNAGGGGEPDEFMEVWDRNLEDAFVRIREIVKTYPYIGMVMASCLCNCMIYASSMAMYVHVPYPLSPLMVYFTGHRISGSGC